MRLTENINLWIDAPRLEREKYSVWIFVNAVDIVVYFSGWP